MSRDELYEYLKCNNVYARKYFYPLTSDQACFKNKYKNIDLKNAKEISKKILVLPFYEELDLENIYNIIEMLKR